MRTLIIAVLAITALTLTGCGGGDASGVQGDAAKQTIADLKAEDIEVDEGCVHDAAKDLSDADATAILNNTDEISAAGEEIGLKMFLTCTGIGDLDG